MGDQLGPVDLLPLQPPQASALVVEVNQQPPGLVAPGGLGGDGVGMVGRDARLL